MSQRWVLSVYSTGDVPQGPDGLLADVQVRRRQQFDEGRNASSLHDSTSLLRGARGDVGESPGGLKLYRREFRRRQEADEFRDEAGRNDAVDGWLLFHGEKLSRDQK